MDNKGKGVAVNRRWAVDFTDNSTSHSSRDIPDPPGFTRSSPDQVPPSFLNSYVYLKFVGFVFGDYGFLFVFFF